MVNRNLIYSLEDQAIEDELSQLFGTNSIEELDTEYDPGDILFPDGTPDQKYELNSIVQGKIVRVDNDVVVVDVGFKSEGTISRSEWTELEPEPEVGQEVSVLIEDLEDEQGRADDPSGLIAVSKEKADIIRKWTDVVAVSYTHLTLPTTPYV